MLALLPGAVLGLNMLVWKNWLPCCVKSRWFSWTIDHLGVAFFSAWLVTGSRWRRRRSKTCRSPFRARTCCPRFETSPDRPRPRQLRRIRPPQVEPPSSSLLRLRRCANISNAIMSNEKIPITNLLFLKTWPSPISFGGEIGGGASAEVAFALLTPQSRIRIPAWIFSLAEIFSHYCFVREQ